MKGLFTVLLAVCIIILCVACEIKNLEQDEQPNLPEQDMAQDITGQDIAEQDMPWKIAIYTTERHYGRSILDYPNEYQEGRAYIKYPEQVVLGTIIEQFSQKEQYEKELVEKGLALIQDEQIKVFIASMRSEELLREIKKQRPDILIISFGGYDNLYETELSDIILVIDILTMSERMVQQAFTMGANTFIYYASYKSTEISSLMERYCIPIIEDTCDKLGMKYIMEDISLTSIPPDTIHVDLEEKVSQYGKNIFAYVESCSFSVSLFNDAMRLGLIMSQPCHPSIFCGFPGWYWGEDRKDYGIITEFDFDQQIERAREKAAEMGMTGRSSCWRVPFNTLPLTAAIDFAIDYINNDLQADIDLPTMEKYFIHALESLGVDANEIGLELTQHPDYPNCFMFTEDYILI